MKNPLLIFFLKVILFILSIALIIFPFAINIHSFKNTYEPRTSIFNRVDFKKYSFALMGDSAFGSYYVNSNSDTIWEKFESFTGRKCFPGAINGARNGDLVKAAKYISHKMPVNSIIFINITPIRFLLTNKVEENNYVLQFDELFQEEMFIVYKYIYYFDLEYIKYPLKFSANKNYGLDRSNQYNRVWNIDGSFAIDRYKKFLVELENATPSDDGKLIEEINRIILINKSKPVFVLSALNKKQIYAYSNKKSADRIIYIIKEMHDKIINNLNKMNSSYIDLFDSVPDNCFSDLFHTNACGDKIIARSLADYVEKTRGDF